MHSLLALAAPLALMLPMAAGVADSPEVNAGPKVNVGKVSGAPVPQCDAAGLDEAPRVNPLAAYRSSATARQVRIEQRVVVRISPRPLAARQNLTDDLPEREVSTRLEERGKEKCIALQGIAGVQTGSGNRLVLFLRDRSMISVNLEKSCRARDFYSGFYVEKNKDGRICVARDRLQSRTGASCEVEAMHHLVEVRG